MAYNTPNRTSEYIRSIMVEEIEPRSLCRIMAYKTPNRTSEYIRSIMVEEIEPCLASIAIEADKGNIPILLPESASFLKQLLMLKRPLNVLELGTAIGYSGSIILKHSECKLTTIDKNEEYLKRAREHFDSLGFAGRYEILQGDSDEIVPLLTGRYDLIFLDGAKTKYVKYLPYLLNVLVDGGILLADNVLFNGMVAGETELNEKKKNIVNSLDRFLKELYKTETLITSVLNVGDGMSLSIKAPSSSARLPS